MVRSYKRIDTTADVGLISFGATLEVLFANTAKGLFSLITPLSHIRGEKSLNVRVNAPSIEELLVVWLNELIYVHEVERIVLKGFNIDIFNNKVLEAVCLGESIDTRRHLLKMYVKAATYHRLSIWRRGDNLWQAHVILDV